MAGRTLNIVLAAAVAALALLLGPMPGFAQTSRDGILPREALARARPADGDRDRRGANDDKVVLVMTGVIGPGSYNEFRRAVRQNRPELVILDSPGGILGEALFMGEEVRRRGLNTLVGANGQCASACAVVFLSGRTKYVGKGAAIGLHAASDLDGRVDTEATGLMAKYLRNVGVSRAILQRMAATAPNKMRWLTRSELKALKIRAYPG